MQKIIEDLASLANHGDSGFCSKTTVDYHDLNLSIKDFGPVKLPLSTASAKKLIKLAKPAKYGWRDQTLLDKNIRDVWEIAKSRVKIDNRTWNKTLTPLLDKFRAKLGLPEGARLKPHLHNMLVYEKGQFFQTHQDSEKLEGMVATLVLVLPCEHSGGALVIEHQGTQKRFSTTQPKQDKITAFAFYADCQHEIKPVTSGYRVSLTYNLVLEGANTAANNIDQDAPQIKAMCSALNAHFTEMQQRNETRPSWRGPNPPKWVYLLDHQYTQAGLSWHYLKDRDRTRADALKMIADQMDYEIFLAQADIQESWQCEDDYYDQPRWRRGRHYWNDDDDENEDAGATGYELIELIESQVELKNWCTTSGETFDGSGIAVDSGELFWTKAVDEYEPFESDYEGYMGNYGNTLDRWYHRAAIILWRKEDHYAFQCSINPKGFAKTMTALAKKADTRPQAQTLVEKNLIYWKNHGAHHYDPALLKAAFALAVPLQNPELAKSLLDHLNLSILTPTVMKAWVDLDKAYGASWSVQLLESWTQSNRYESMAKIHELRKAVEALGALLPSEHPVLTWFMDYMEKRVNESHQSSKKTGSLAWLQSRAGERIQDIIDLLAVCACLKAQKRHASIIQQLLQDEILYPSLHLLKIHQYFIDTYEKTQSDVSEVAQQWGFQQLFNALKERFEQLIHSPERQEGDWSIQEQSTCACDDCSKLNRYLASETQQSLTWPLNKERRQHIHGAIDGLGIPVTHATKREGSPHKLMLNKTQELFEREKRFRDEAREALACLE